MNQTLVSVVIPVYNASITISDTIQSILQQTYKNIELIIIDDGSTDNTIDIVSSFTDSRIKFYKRVHKGPGPQRNFGIMQSSGEFIALIDADDIAYQTRIAKQMDYMRLNPEVDILGTKATFINENGRNIGNYDIPINDIDYFFPVYCPLITSSIIFKKGVIHKVGYFREISEPCTDYEWLLEAFKNGLCIRNISERLMKFRRSKNSFTRVKLKFLNKKMFFITSNSLNDLYKDQKKDYAYYFRMGLVYYYYGDVNKSRKFFFHCIKITPQKLFINLRYILPSFFGNYFLTLLRNSNIAFHINKVIQLMGYNIAYKK